MLTFRMRTLQCASRQTIATLLRKHSQPAPCGHRLRWLTKTLAEL